MYFRKPVFSAVAMVLSMVAISSVAPPARANPSKVAQILQRGGRAAVVRGPQTISKEQKAELQQIAERLSAKWNARVYFVLIPQSANNETYARLYDELGMSGGDLLAVSNGKGLALRCNGLSKNAKEAAWQAFRDAPRGPKAKFSALVAALPQELSTKAAAPPPADRAPSAPSTPTEQPASGDSSDTVFFAVLLIAGVALVIWRRKRRDASVLADFNSALDPVESDLADLFLSLDGKEQATGYESLLTQATDLSARVEAIKVETPNRQAISKLKTLSRDAAWLKDEMSKLGDD